MYERVLSDMYWRQGVNKVSEFLNINLKALVVEMICSAFIKPLGMEYCSY